MPIKLRTKLFLPLIIFCVIFGGYAHFVWFNKYIASFIQNHERDIQAHLTTAAEGLIPLLLEDRLAAVFGNLDALLDQNKQWVSLELYDADNTLLYPLKEPHPSSDKETIKHYTQSVSFGGPAIATLKLNVDFSDIYSSVSRMEKDFHIALAILLFIAIVSIFGIVEFVVSRPVRAMTLASKKISEGNFTGHMPSKVSGEIGDLVDNFIKMRDSISAYQKKLKGEIESHKKTAEELFSQKELASYQASHDALTGLINRREFEARVNTAIRCSQKDGSSHVLLYVDLDQFKIVNDTCGHIAGDSLLKQLSAVLKDKTRDTDTLGRLGGDEFGFLFEYCNKKDGYEIARNLLDVVRDFRFSWNEKIFNVGASIGLVEFDADAGSYFDILSAADSACYSAKDRGRNRIKIYQSEDADLSHRKGEMLWTTRLITALENDQLLLCCQPIVSLNEHISQASSYGDINNTVKHYEVLLRIKGENGEMIYPDSFISAAERYNLIGRIDRWVIEHVFEFVEKYRKRNNGIFDLKLSINLSGVSLEKSMLEFIEALFVKYNPPVGAIGIEITETAAIQNLAQAVIFMDVLNKYGCQFYLDDFGSGLSSFNYLKSLPVDFVKIDGGFVCDIESDPLDLAMVKSINEIAHVMGKKTIAEFVASEKIAGMLKAIGVDYAQGYHVGKPFLIGQLFVASSHGVTTNTGPHELSFALSQEDNEGNGEKVKNKGIDIAEAS